MSPQKSIHHNEAPDNVKEHKGNNDKTTTLEMTHDSEFETIFSRLIVIYCLCEVIFLGLYY